MEKDEITPQELERLAALMAQAIPTLDCPECCDCGWTYQYIERSAELYREEWEWACLANTLIHYRMIKVPRQQG